MRGIDDLKKWSEETAEFVVEKKTDGNKSPTEKTADQPKKSVPEEIDLLGLDEPASKPIAQPPTKPVEHSMEDVSMKKQFPAPPAKKPEGPMTTSDQDFDLLGGDFTPTSKPVPQAGGQIAQPKPVSNLDLFDLNLNM
jgi:hypothetical protein